MICIFLKQHVHDLDPTQNFNFPFLQEISFLKLLFRFHPSPQEQHWGTFWTATEEGEKAKSPPPMAEILGRFEALAFQGL